jgi:Na+-driven multidrug efflux pump
MSIPEEIKMSSAKAMDARTRVLLEAPIAGTLLRLAAPNVLVMTAQAAAGLVETYFIGKLGTDPLAGVALVFPVVMFMQMMSAGAMGGGIASAIARALGAGRRADANALVSHAMVIAIGFGFLFMVGVLAFGRALYAAMGGTGGSLDAALIYSNWVFASAVLVWLFNSLAAVIRGIGNMAVPAIVTCAGARHPPGLDQPSRRLRRNPKMLGQAMRNSVGTMGPRNNRRVRGLNSTSAASVNDGAERLLLKAWPAI